MKCGKKVPESAGFCPFCGVKLDEEKRAASRKSGLRRKINPKVGKRGGRQSKSFKGAKIPLPEEVDAVFYGGWVYQVLGLLLSEPDPRECVKTYADLFGRPRLRDEEFPDPAPALMKRIKKTPWLVDGPENSFFKHGARSIALIGYGAVDIQETMNRAEILTTLFDDEISIEKTISIWGEGKSRSIPGVAVILKRRESQRGEPATELETFIEDIKELYKTALTGVGDNFIKTLRRLWQRGVHDISYAYELFKEQGADINAHVAGTEFAIWTRIDAKKSILGKKYKPTVRIWKEDKFQEQKIGPHFKHFFDAWRWVKEQLLAREHALRGGSV